MANVVAALANLRGATKFLKRGLKFDNKYGDVMMIKHDGSTTATVTSSTLKRIEEAHFADCEGTKLSPTVTGYGTNSLAVGALPNDTLDIVVLLKGSLV